MLSILLFTQNTVPLILEFHNHWLLPFHDPIDLQVLLGSSLSSKLQFLAWMGQSESLLHVIQGKAFQKAFEFKVQSLSLCDENIA